MNSTIIKMSNAYETMGIQQELDNPVVIDCRDISGTRCYLDDFAYEQIRSRIEKVEPEGIHFIDSGNYHYLSLLMLQKIDKPFSLLLIDKHPDMQLPSFGDIISCGGWLLKAIESLENLQRVYTYGVDEELINGISPLPENVTVIDNECKIEELLGADEQLYISIDKDALSQNYSVSDWDQGNMQLDELLSVLVKVVVGRKLIGVDICADTSNPTDKSDEINLITNKALIDFFGDFL